jgi:cystathionine gamma-synthase
MTTPNTLADHPLWQRDDLGKPLPPSPHAVSVALPLWEHVVGYEEGDEAVVNALQAGYPRFLFNPRVVQLFHRCEERFAKDGERCMVFPCAAVAERCVEYLRAHGAAEARIDAFGAHNLYVVTFAESDFEHAKSFWQHFGEVTSSRQAETALGEAPAPQDGAESKRLLRERLAALVNESPENVYLFPSGMAALAAALRTLQARRPNVQSIQLGIPYVDGLKIQEKADEGVHFLPSVSDETLATIQDLARKGYAGMFCEVPGNPLLRTPDIPGISKALRAHDVPLVVDDTLSSLYNVDLADHADIIVTSLTKYVSGVGDVMGGSLVLNSRSPYYDQLKPLLDATFTDLFWAADANVLELNSRDFTDRIDHINRTAEFLCDALADHSAVACVHFPKFETPEHYRAIQRPGRGYGGLFSIDLKNPEVNAPAFYDALEISKGPNLGTNFSLVCPYVLLAHYDELDWVESLGVSRWLVRVSVGLEDPDDLLARFHRALPK